MPILLVIIAGLLMWVSSEDATHYTEKKYQAACVAKYSYMPYNQVNEYCIKLLKFEKDEK